MYVPIHMLQEHKVTEETFSSHGIIDPSICTYGLTMANTLKLISTNQPTVQLLISLFLVFLFLSHFNFSLNSGRIGGES